MPQGNEPPAPSFLHIDDYDEAKVQALLDRAAEVKALLATGDRSFLPFQGRGHSRQVFSTYLLFGFFFPPTTSQRLLSSIRSVFISPRRAIGRSHPSSFTIPGPPSRAARVKEPRQHTSSVLR